MIDPLEFVLQAPSPLPYATDFSHGVLDVLAWEQARNSQMKYESLPAGFQLISDSLEHITVNPKNIFKTYMLKNSYVYSGVRSDSEHGTCVNTDSRTAEQFARTLIAAAAQEWTAAQSRQTGRDRRYERISLLTGEKGAGKTYFLNHLYSTYSPLFDESKTVWVRVNLSRERGFNGDIGAWYQAQASKILLRYYERTSEYADTSDQPLIDIIGPLNAWVEEHRAPVERALAREKVNRVVDLFSRLGPDELVTPAVLSPDLALKIYRTAIEAGLRFVVVLDGYDLLDCDRQNRGRFKRIGRGLRGLIANSTRAGAAFVIVCRTETLAQMSNAYSLSSDRQVASYCLGSAPFYDIVINRIENLLGWIKRVADSNLALDGEDLYEAMQICLDFKDYFVRRFEAGDYRELTELFPMNNRACVQMLASEFSVFASRKNEPAAYRIIEMITLAGFKFPPVIYEYFLGSDGSLTCQYNSGEGRISFDTRFLPLITRPPIPTRRQRLRIGASYTPESVLHGVRLLQVLQLYQNRVEHDDSGAPQGELIRLLTDSFGYEPQVTEAYLYELEAYGCILIKREYWDQDRNDEDGVLLMPKGAHLLSSTLSDPAYLNLCAMRTVSGRRSIEMGMFRSTSLPSGRTAGHRQFLEWAINKVVNSMNLARLVLHINERQEALWDQVDLDRVYLLGEVNFGRHDIKSVFGSTRGAMGAVVNHIYDIYVRIAEDFGRYELKAVYSALTPAELKELLTAWLFSAGPTGGREVQFPR